MTVYEQIKEMSIEEMAKFLTSFAFACENCSQNTKDVCDCRCTQHCAEWLQEEAKN